MPKITFKMQETGKLVVADAQEKQTILDAALKAGVHIEHACEKSCACTTCHIYVTAGGKTISQNSEEEDDMLDRAWGLQGNSRLSCQATVGTQDIEVEVPKYTLNLASESH